MSRLCILALVMCLVLVGGAVAEKMLTFGPYRAPMVVKNPLSSTKMEMTLSPGDWVTCTETAMIRYPKSDKKGV
jgi:hypothetical protein